MGSGEYGGRVGTAGKAQFRELGGRSEQAVAASCKCVGMD